jgi:hypothetical protein
VAQPATGRSPQFQRSWWSDLPEVVWLVTRPRVAIFWIPRPVGTGQPPVFSEPWKVVPVLFNGREWTNIKLYHDIWENNMYIYNIISYHIYMHTYIQITYIIIYYVYNISAHFACLSAALWGLRLAEFASVGRFFSPVKRTVEVVSKLGTPTISILLAYFSVSLSS